MSWLSDFVRPKVQALLKKKDIPDDLWSKCSRCEKIIFKKELEAALFVCPSCDMHMSIGADLRLQYLFDDGKYEVVEVPDVVVDPLKFKDRKKYSDRLKELRSKGALKEAILVGKGTINSVPTVIAAFDFRFIGGSMGMYVGESIVRAAEVAVKNKMPLIVIPSSGGARMQEGVLSLMQMARTTVAVNMLKNAKLPYIVLCTNPTTGGVSASFAMLGDVQISEPGATIGFAGARVVEQTIHQKLPEGFQTAEYLLDHGMLDMVVHRHQLKQTLGRLIRIFMKLDAIV
jgi:acetyl-CoA carboxylase carboxyl transferase subunit beta